MNELKKLLLELDEHMQEVYQTNAGEKKFLEKTDNINVTGERSRVIDMLLEETIIDFFKEKAFPCVIVTEERGKVALTATPKFVVITDPLDGTTNFSRGIPLTCYGIAIAKIREKSEQTAFNDIQAAAVRSFHTDEFFLSDSKEGSTLNNRAITPSKETNLQKSLLAIDLDRIWHKKPAKVQAVLSIVKQCKGIRRFGANLLDMCYVAAGRIECMIDIRNMLSIVHAPGLFIAKKSGAVLSTKLYEEFNPTLEAQEKMSFVLCNNANLASKILAKLDESHFK